MIGRLFNVSTQQTDDSGAVGTSCIGSSEAIMLGVLAMKKRWKNKRKAAGLSTENPNIIVSYRERGKRFRRGGADYLRS